MLISQIKRFKTMDTSWEVISTLTKAPNNTVNNLGFQISVNNISEKVNNLFQNGLTKIVKFWYGRV